MVVTESKNMLRVRQRSVRRCAPSFYGGVEAPPSYHGRSFNGGGNETVRKCWRVEDSPRPGCDSAPELAERLHSS